MIPFRIIPIMVLILVCVYLQSLNNNMVGLKDEDLQIENLTDEDNYFDDYDARDSIQHSKM
jgi:hypothetical protein